MNPLPKSAFRNVFHKVRGFLNHWYDIYIYIYIYIFIYIYIYVFIRKICFKSEERTVKKGRF